MKTSLSLSLIVAGFGALAACSSDEGAERNNGGTGTIAGAGGQVGGAGTSSGGTSSGGTSSGGAGGGGNSNPTEGTLGQPLSITPEAVVDVANNTNINGGIAVTFSSVQTVEPTIEQRADGLCFKGTTATVPNDTSYGTHWGAEMILDLNRVANPDAPAGDAGADAGADAGPVLGQVAQDWPQGNVIGFSYTLVGNDPTAADQGVPNAQVRFKAVPVGANTANDNYCSNRTPASGVRENVLFKDITFECWTPGNYTLEEDPIQYVVTPDPNKMVGTRPNPRAFRNVSWQISSDLLIPPIKYDFCVTDLRPILATP
jgi:hypothetical protein